MINDDGCDGDSDDGTNFRYFNVVVLLLLIIVISLSLLLLLLLFMSHNSKK